MNRLRSPLIWIAVLSTAAGLVYLHRLGSSPAYLSIEEVSQFQTWANRKEMRSVP